MVKENVMEEKVTNVEVEDVTDVVVENVTEEKEEVTETQVNPL